jgi:hypothetical protein
MSAGPVRQRSLDVSPTLKEEKLKKKLIAGVLLSLLAAAANAGAEQKLLVTEVLDRGEVEAAARLEYLHEKADFDLGAESGELSRNSWESTFTLGLGVGHNLELGASIPYILRERERLDFEGAAESESERRDGFGDLTLGVKYRLLDEEPGSVALVAGLDVKFDTASEEDGGTGTTDVSPYLALSRTLDERYKPYAVYRATFRNHDESDEHSLTAGLEAEMCERATLDAAFKVTHNTSSDLFDSYQTYGAEVATYIEVGHNLYLIPAVGLERSTSIDGRGDAEPLDIDPVTTFRGALTLYALY